MSEKIARLFSQYVQKQTEVTSLTVETPCWLYTGWQDRNGYGRYTIERPGGHPTRRRKHIQAHRLAWILSGRKIPEGMVLDHLCMVRNCVRPSHLEVVTQEENVRRRDEYAANVKGVTS